MPFLWKYQKKLSISKKSPSPKCKKIMQINHSIERVSLLISPTKKVAASMTVEAAIVLPLFLFFFVNLGSSMEMLRLHGKLQLALWDVGNRMCVYGYAADHAGQILQEAESEDGAWWKDLADIALSYTYVKQEVISYTGREYLDESPLSYGCSGLQFWESDLFGTSDAVEGEQELPAGDILDIVLTYQVSPWLEIPAVRSFRMSNRYYGRLWTGYDIGGVTGEAQEEQDMVYITDNASVYHESPECTHLKLSIREVTMEEAMERRNEEGKRYKECSKCRGKPFAGTVFIGREGEFYHYSRECSGLKRTVHAIPRQEAEKYRPCSRCAGSR